MFPVVVVPYDAAWPRVFEAERSALRSALADLDPEIEHVRSTAVPRLAAKPKIDILVGLRRWEDLDAAVGSLSGLGYEHEPQIDVPRHLSMERGHPTTHRVHLVELNGAEWRNMLTFRDALRSDADLRDRYGELKQELARRHGDDHQAYSSGKAPFTEDVIQHERVQTRLKRSSSASVEEGAFHESDMIRRLRQWPTLRALAEFVEGTKLYLGALVIGSFAAGTADEMSDLDLILITLDEGFEDAWTRRGELHVTGALAAWDERPVGAAGTHKWVTPDCIFVECLIATSAGGVRLAQPAVVIAGEADLPDRLEERLQISRTEMSQATHPIERAYDELKAAVRASRSADPNR